ncbi:hypothetical protein NDU88_002528 [Pleurodeles waltl]|uniref:Uncharacterized protein n=1 Tax=Pleurodeles waltl TaxID=8319 RepID=A0AAV7WPT6_PLEWA|nr:hypothetical protein NDU88_002528 [Pleurodeles waltl]
MKRPKLRPQAGNIIITDKEDKDGSRSVLSTSRASEVEADTREDKEAWFEDWWTPPVETTKPATTQESCG